MIYKLTQEQEAIVQTVVNQSTDVLSIQAVAGSSKTTTMVEATKRLYATKPNLQAEYTVFGSANAKEAGLAYGHSCQAATISSKAYKAVVTPYRLKLPITDRVSYRDVPSSYGMLYRDKLQAINLLTRFCKSGFVDTKSFVASIEEEVSEELLHNTDLLLNGLSEGHIPITHDFYLKLYHILVMNDTIVVPKVDLLIFDEAGDATRIARDIFVKREATMKVIIGDEGQSIYGFLGLVSIFDTYRDNGLHLNLTKSFRVNSVDAKLVQAYCRSTFNQFTDFVGMEYSPNTPSKTIGYLARNNSTLISRMIEFSQQGIAFRLSTSAKIDQLFAWPEALMKLSPGGKMKGQFAFLQADANNWYSSGKLRRIPLLDYILEINEGHDRITSAIKLLKKYDHKDILTAHKAAKVNRTSNATTWLLTAHTAKGLTLDETYIEEDLNKAVLDAMTTPKAKRTPSDIETLKLGYVAATRHRLVIHNAKFLEPYKEDIMNE